MTVSTGFSLSNLTFSPPERPKPSPPGLTMRPPPVLMEELLEEFFFRLPPDEPAWLIRASAVCKPWRGIVADSGFRRRYREFHRTPPILGLFPEAGISFLPIPRLFPAHPYHCSWAAMDCRHGRALFAQFEKTVDFVVLDPVTGHQRRVPSPCNFPTYFSAAVLCAAQGCDHHDCQGRQFLVAVVCGDELKGATLGWLYSSETHLWTKLTTAHCPNAEYFSNMGVHSVLVGDALYFNMSGGVMECQLGTLGLSMFEKPINGDGTLMTAEDGGLGFAVVDAANLTLWSREAGVEGVMGWTKLRVIDFRTLLPNDNLSIPIELGTITRVLMVTGFAEGTQVVFVRTHLASYMVDLRSGRARKVSRHGSKSFPYTSFYIPAMAAASPGQGQ